MIIVLFLAFSSSGLLATGGVKTKALMEYSCRQGYVFLALIRKYYVRSSVSWILTSPVAGAEQMNKPKAVLRTEASCYFTPLQTYTYLSRPGIANRDRPGHVCIGPQCGFVGLAIGGLTAISILKRNETIRAVKVSIPSIDQDTPTSTDFVEIETGL